MSPPWTANASASADAIVRGLVDLFELVFPSRIRGYYLLGSLVEGTAVALSDIDLVLLFKERYEGEEEAMAQRVVAACRLLCPIRLDIVPLSEATLRPEDLRLKLGSRVVAGEDVRERLPLPAPAAHARYITDWSNSFIRRLHDGAPLAFPLRYPDSAETYFGYTQVRIPEWYPRGTTQGTKELVATVCWTANALLSLLLGAEGYVGTKGDSVRRYSDAGDGDWGGFVAAVYTRCKGAWRYAVPEEAGERAELRALCERTLPYFNHYLDVYQRYLRQQQGVEDATQRRWAAEQLRELAAG